MTWRIEYTATAAKRLKKLNKSVAQGILDYMDNRVSCREDPRTLGEPLRYELSGCWRYRVGDYRVICQIKDDVVTVLVLEIGHRRGVYS